MEYLRSLFVAMHNAGSMTLRELYATVSNSIQDFFSLLGADEHLPLLFAVLIVLCFVLLLILTIRLHRERKEIDRLANLAEEALFEQKKQKRIGTLELRCGKDGAVKKTEIVSYAEPHWLCDDEFVSELTFYSPGDEGLKCLDIAPDEFAVYVSDAPDEDITTKSEWLAVVISHEGKVVLKKLTQDNERINCEDNYMCVWDSKHHLLAIYCGYALAITAVPHEHETASAS